VVWVNGCQRVRRAGRRVEGELAYLAFETGVLSKPRNPSSVGLRELGLKLRGEYAVDERCWLVLVGISRSQCYLCSAFVQAGCQPSGNDTSLHLSTRRTSFGAGGMELRVSWITGPRLIGSRI
jgi:hypothetical protein